MADDSSLFAFDVRRCVIVIPWFVRIHMKDYERSAMFSGEMTILHTSKHF